VAVLDTPEVGIAGARSATRRLFETLDIVDDVAVTRPSLLDGWTVGHVLTHLARNADSHVRLLRAAVGGRGANRYPGGVAQRTGEIESGSARSASELVADVRSAAATLDALWQEIVDSDSAAADVWAVVGKAIDRDEPVHRLPWLRWREIEVHHADLGLAGFTYDNWSSEYVRRELRLAEMAWRASHPMGLTQLPPRALALTPHRRLAWLLGRIEVDGLPQFGQWW
jgi:maleylpyruvate isomerase